MSIPSPAILMNALKKSYSTKTLVFVSLFLIASMGLVLRWTTPYMMIATFSYSLLCMGVALRKNRGLHPYFMTTGAAIDILLVLTLEMQRSAIATAMGGKLNAAQAGHIVCSLIAVLLYIPAMIYGRRAMSQGSSPTEQTHRYLGRIAFGLRTIGFFLMFSMLGLIKH